MQIERRAAEKLRRSQNRKFANRTLPTRATFFNFNSRKNPMNADVLATKVIEGIAVITLVSAKGIYFDAERKGLVHETVSGKAIDRAMEIARRLSSHTPESLGYIKRLVRNATDTPLAQGLALERNLFLKFCVSDQGLARMRSYEEKKISVPSRSIEI
jgi:hypothetical protein